MMYILQVSAVAIRVWLFSILLDGFHEKRKNRINKKRNSENILEANSSELQQIVFLTVYSCTSRASWDERGLYSMI